MKIIGLHFIFLLKKFLRQPSYIVSTLIFPSLFFLIFAKPNADVADKANLLAASFAAFAVIGVAFLQFGVDMSIERSYHWNTYLRTLPTNPMQIILARFGCAVVFSLLSAWLVLAVVQWTTPANFDAKKIAMTSLALLIGSFPLTLLAITVGMWVHATSALPIANLTYIVLSFAGGLWIPPNALPEGVRDFSHYLPTRAYGELVWSAMLGHTLENRYIAYLGGYTVVFLALALWRFRKLEA